MKAFVFAMEKEAHYLKEETELLETKKHGVALYEKRKYNGQTFVLVLSGIGKSLSAAAISALPLLYQDVDAVINFGVSGSLNGLLLSPFSYFAPTSFVNYDIDTVAFGDPKGLFFNPNRVYFESDIALHNLLLLKLQGENLVSEGVEVAGDSFIAKESKKEELRKEWKALACDMETASLASVCYSLPLPFSALRLISDSSNSAEEYERNLDNCARMLKDSALKLL